jgi:Flp pilus assembly pilin Flp
MNTTNIKHIPGTRKQKGQGMTEYIIIVALIAIAAIGVYSKFGKTVKDEVVAVTAGLAGDAGTASANTARATADEQAANGEAGEQLGMQNFTQDVGK